MVKGGQLTLPMTCDVPQGFLIGPCLFTLFVNDLPGLITHGQIIQYADDALHLDSAPANETGLASGRHRMELTMSEFKTHG